MCAFNVLFLVEIQPKRGKRCVQSKLCHLWAWWKSQKLITLNQKASHHKVPMQQHSLTLLTIFPISNFLLLHLLRLDHLSHHNHHLHTIINVLIFALLCHVFNSPGLFPCLLFLITPPHTTSSSPRLAQQQRSSAGPESGVGSHAASAANLVSRNQGDGARHEPVASLCQLTENTPTPSPFVTYDSHSRHKTPTV